MEHGDSTDGFAAIDTLEFDYNPEALNCAILPHDADVHQPTTTTAPQTGFPDCTFEEDSCGWFIDEFTDMKWFITNSSYLQNQGFDSPGQDIDGNFLYVNALKGNSTSRTEVSTPFIENNTVAACLIFQFNIKVNFRNSCFLNQPYFPAQWRYQVIECVHRTR